MIYALTDSAEFLVFSYWAIAAGVVTGLVAAVAGGWDWLHIPRGKRAKAVGAWQGGGTSS